MRTSLYDKLCLIESSPFVGSNEVSTTSEQVLSVILDPCFSTATGFGSSFTPCFQYLVPGSNKINF